MKLPDFPPEDSDYHLVPKRWRPLYLAQWQWLYKSQVIDGDVTWEQTPNGRVPKITLPLQSVSNPYPFDISDNTTFTWDAFDQPSGYDGVTIQLANVVWHQSSYQYLDYTIVTDVDLGAGTVTKMQAWGFIMRVMDVNLTFNANGQLVYIEAIEGGDDRTYTVIHDLKPA